MKSVYSRILCLFLLLSLLFTGCTATDYTAGSTGAATGTSTQTTTQEIQPDQTTQPAQSSQADLPENSSFSIHFIDVGQADAALVICDGAAMLIDGGNAEDSNLLYTYLKKHNINNLTYVIGTHAHEDHIGGIAGALRYANAAMVLCPVTSYSSKAFQNFAKAAKEQCGGIEVPKVGDTFTLGSAQGTILAVNTNDDTNNTSIVLRIVYGETSFLFTGDAETPVEQAILDRDSTVKSTVLKVGHHGSDSSTGYRWLREVAPEHAVISVGKGNSYGHPTETVLSRLRDADVKTYRTDMQGDIICTSDGKNVSFTVSRNKDADTFGGIGENSTQKDQTPTQPTETQPKETEAKKEQGTHYILNTNTMKFHEAGCGSAARIKTENRKDYYGTREELIKMGYSPCGNCDP